MNISSIFQRLSSIPSWRSQQHFVRLFKSDISLEKLYPNSKHTIFTPTAPAINKESFNGVIPLDQLKISYERASGPGGQNVNKVATKVDLRFNVQQANWISENVKERIIAENQTKINREGFFIIKSDVTRYQQLNLADALEKLRNLIRNAEKPIKVELSPEKLESIRKSKERNARERLIEKRKRSEIKAGRQDPRAE